MNVLILPAVALAVAVAAVAGPVARWIRGQVPNGLHARHRGDTGYDDPGDGHTIRDSLDELTDRWNDDHPDVRMFEIHHDLPGPGCSAAAPGFSTRAGELHHQRRETPVQYWARQAWAAAAAATTPNLAQGNWRPRPLYKPSGDLIDSAADPYLTTVLRTMLDPGWVDGVIERHFSQISVPGIFASLGLPAGGAA
jgi:hypothetical protein